MSRYRCAVYRLYGVRHASKRRGQADTRSRSAVVLREVEVERNIMITEFNKATASQRTER